MSAGNASVQHITYAPPVTSSTFTYNRVMQVAGGTWQLQQRSTEAWPTRTILGTRGLKKSLVNWNNVKLRRADMCYLDGIAIRRSRAD